MSNEYEEFEKWAKKNSYFGGVVDNAKNVAELEAHINVLRESLERVNDAAKGIAMSYIHKQCKEALASTPQQSLQNVIDETIERCAKVCDELVIENVGRADLTANQCAIEIRALKGKQND